MRKWFFVLMLVCFLLPLSLAQTVVISQTSDDSTGNLVIFNNGTISGQTFTAPSTFIPQKIQLKGRNDTMTTGTLIIELYETSGGFPTGSPLTSGSVNVSQLSSTNNPYNVTFVTSQILNSGSVYAVIGRCQGCDMGTITYRANMSNPYVLGTVISSTNQGVSWSNVSNFDFYFQVFSTGQGSLSIDLNSPANGTTNFGNPLFNSSATLVQDEGNTLEFKNATLYIWNSTGGLFNTTTNSVSPFSPGNFRESTWNVSGFDIGSYTWNTVWCAVNLTTNVCNTFLTNLSFSVGAQVNNNSYNYTSIETASESFITNVTLPFGYSVSSAYLIWNGSSYEGSISNPAGTNWLLSKTIDLPVVNGNVSWFWSVNYANGIQQNFSTNSQVVSELFFGLRNSTYTTTYLNLTFKDENDLSIINASIPSSTFSYYVGSGSVSKNFTFANNTDNFNYAFASNANRTLYVQSVVQYRRVSDYPQRIWTPGLQSYSSSVTDEVLYLLNSADGIFVTFQVINIAEQPLSGVSVNATRQVSGNTVIVGTGETDSTGSVTFFLNPDFEHTICFVKSGFETYCTNLFPTQTGYTITLGSTSSGTFNLQQGISYLVFPQDFFLFQYSLNNFTFSLSSTYWSLDSWGFNLTYSNGTSIGSQSSTSETGGSLTIANVNVSNSSSIIMRPYYIVQGNITYVNPYTWQIQIVEGSQYSIWNFFSRFSTYTSVGLFGFDDFGRIILSIVVIVVVVGMASRRWGIASEGAISGLIFGVVFLLEIGLNFIPQITIGDRIVFRGTISAVAFILLLAVAIREESR